MTKNVWITINGTQTTDGQSETIEMVSQGNYFKKNGKHYILFEEQMEGEKEVCHNTIKIMPHCMELIRKGTARTHMIFEIGKEIITGYQTPIGELMMGICTNRFQIMEEEGLIEINAEYSLSINDEHVSDCCIKVTVRNR